MNDREIRRYEMFVRVKTFGADNAADFAAGSKAKEAFDIVSGVIDDLDAARAGQKSGRSTSKEVLLDAVRLDIQNITRTAAAIAQDEPGFAEKFRPPTNSNEGALLAAADKILQQLTAQPALVAKFVAHEMNANFVTSLQNDRAAIATAQSQQESTREDSVGSTASIGPLIETGMKAVTTLDAIMHNKYGSNPDKMAAWQSASHVERHPQRAKAATANTPKTS